MYLGIDPGRNWGWAALSSGKGNDDYGSGEFQSLLKFHEDVKGLIRRHDVRAVCTCRAMGRNQQVIRFHSAMAAIVEITCEYDNIAYFDVADCSIRKVVMGKGNAKKPEVMAYLKIGNEHAADAMLAARYLKNATITSPSPLSK